MNQYLQANQERWDRLTSEHENSPFYDLAGFKAGKDRLRSIELAELGDVAGKTLLHLQCHFGLDTLAWARRGAITSGVDFSAKAIDLARSLSEKLEIPAQFYCTDIYELPRLLSAEFDIVFTSYGVLHGLPDLGRWAELIAGYLKPGGLFYIVEDHPFFRVFRPKPEGEFKAERSYFFSEEPQRIEAKGSYATGDGSYATGDGSYATGDGSYATGDGSYATGDGSYATGDGSYATGDEGATEVYYVWDHSLGEVIDSLIAAGLRIEFLHEFPYAARAKFPFMEQGEDGWWRLPPHQHGTIPFLFSLQARKPV